MLQRNKELRRALAVAVAVTVAAAAAAGALAGLAAQWAGAGNVRGVGLVAAGAALACGATLMGLFARFTARRYRELSRMAERVDEALHTGRAPALSDMSEGEVAILASEVDKALTRLTISAEELAAEKASLADSLADISHQLRTPLTSLGLTLALARKQAGAHASEQLLAHLRTSERLLAQVQWLVEALLKLARIDAGAVRLRRAPVDVARLVDAAAAPLAIPFELAGVRLELELEPGASFVGDAAWSAEALENVLKNCLEHTPAGGRVRVAATEDAIACRITVTDTGPGIAEEDLPHVFERFYRGGTRATGEPVRSDTEQSGAGTGAADGGTGPRGRTGYGHEHTVGAGASEVNPAGVGIGLALAQSLVAAQDGRITAGNVRDERGVVRGARFDLTFFKAVV